MAGQVAQQGLRRVNVQKGSNTTKSDADMPGIQVCGVRLHAWILEASRALRPTRNRWRSDTKKVSSMRPFTLWLQSTPFYQTLEPCMNLRQLRYFVAVAEELHFGRAAVRLHISQPPLSQQIRNLEEILGVTLFTREKKRIELTFAGQVFLDSARKLLEQSQLAIHTARRAAKGEVGTLAIGYASSIPFTGLIGRVVREFRSQRPDVQLRIREMRAVDQIKALVERDIDIGFAREPLLQTHPQVESRCVYHEAFVLAVPAEHPLSHKPSVRLTELRHESFVLYPRDCGTVLYDQVIHLCHEAGFVPNVIQETPQFASVLDLVSAGLGISIVPASTANATLPHVCFRPISDTVAHTAVSIVYRKEEHPTALSTLMAMSGAEGGVGDTPSWKVGFH